MEGLVYQLDPSGRPRITGHAFIRGDLMDLGWAPAVPAEMIVPTWNISGNTVRITFGKTEDDFGPPLPDNSQELRDWLMSPEGCEWSKLEHKVVKHHALVEDYDDSSVAEWMWGGRARTSWDNSQWQMIQTRPASQIYSSLCKGITWGDLDLQFDPSITF